MEGINVNELLDRAKMYINSLNQNEKIGWMMIGVGVIFLILGLVFW